MFRFIVICQLVLFAILFNMDAQAVPYAGHEEPETTTTTTTTTEAPTTTQKPTGGMYFPQIGSGGGYFPIKFPTMNNTGIPATPDYTSYIPSGFMEQLQNGQFNNETFQNCLNQARINYL